MTTHTCISILYCRVYPQLPPVIGAPWGCCGHASGIYSTRPLWFGGCATHATPCSVPGYSYFRMCLEKSERNCLTSYLQQSSRVLFLFACLKACFRLSLSTRNKKKRMVTSKKHAYRPETSYCVYYSLNSSSRSSVAKIPMKPEIGTLLFRTVVPHISPAPFPSFALESSSRAGLYHCTLGSVRMI